MDNSKPDPEIRKVWSDAPADEYKVAAFINGDDETPDDSDVQTSGNPDGEAAERKQTTVYLDANVKRKLKAYCELEGCEMSELVNDLVADELEDWAPEF